MGGVSLDIIIDDGAVQDALSRLARNAGDVRPVLIDMSEYMLREIEGRFRDEKDPDGNKWKELSFATLYGSFRGRKTKKSGGHLAAFRKYQARRKILTRKGHLRASMVYQISGGTARVGTNKVYAAVHQFGASFSILKTGAEINIPARPFLGINEANRRELIEIAKSHLGV